MSVSSVITLGYGQGVQFIATLGYLPGTNPTPSPDPLLLGGGPGYRRYKSYAELREEYELRTAEEKRVELKRIDEEIAEAEKRRLAALRRSKAKLLAEKAALRLVKLESDLREEINRLRMERVWLMRMIDDEEAILVLLCSLPFH